jgi:hypothetical protein
MKSTNRLARCYRYHLVRAIWPVLIFLGIFCLVNVGLPLIALISRSESFSFTHLGANHALSSFAFLIAGAIFLFVGGYASFREDFNFLLAMNNTRRNQFAAGLLANVAHGFLFLILAVLTGFLEWLTGGLLDPAAQLPWGSSVTTGLDVLGELLLPLVLFWSAYAFGQAAGALSYRLGAVFTVAFWIIFGVSWAIVPILVGLNPPVQAFLIWFTGVGTAQPELHLTWHLALILAVLVAVTGLAMHKSPQRA